MQNLEKKGITKKMKVITIGGATQDIFITHKDPKMLRLYSKKTKKEFLILEEGSKIEIEGLSYHTGGGATNAGTSFSRLGFEVSTIFKIGNDIQAELVLKKLTEENVDTSHVSKTSKLHTGTSIIIPSITGDRTVLAYRGANTQLKKADINEPLIADCNHLYITSLSGNSAKLLPYIIKLAKKHNIPIAANPGSSQLAAGAAELRESLKHIDIFILNSQEANIFMHTLAQANQQLKHQISRRRQDAVYPEQRRGGAQAEQVENQISVDEIAINHDQKAPQLFKSPITYQDICFNLHSYFNEILKRGPKIAVVTNGAEGVYVATSKHIYFCPSIKTKVASTLGAGDAFGSCFVASIISGKSIEESIISGVINSSSVISHLDAKTGLLSKKELENSLKELSADNIEKFPLQ